MRVVFADAGYWIALANPRDHLHTLASQWSRHLEGYRIVTSESVLVEVLNGFAESGLLLRTRAAAATHAILEDPDVEVVPQTQQLFRYALSLYCDRPDKSWSLTDCASFRIMEERKISEALTHDRHFEQCGFRALLRV